MISVIIPALNEEKTIGNVVKFCLADPLVAEVIVVDDRSTNKLLSYASRIPVMTMNKQ